MPIGVCSSCHRRFVVESERSFQRTCPYCLHPMEVSRGGQGPPSPGASPEPPFSPPAQSMIVSWDGAPLSADPQGLRLLTVLAEAAYQRDQARAIRWEARRTRGDTTEVRERRNVRPPRALQAMPPCELPVDPGEPGQPSSAGPTVQARWLTDWALALQERAAEACLQAQMIQDQARVVLENGRLIQSGEAVLPSPDYVLLAEDEALPALEEREPEREGALPPVPEGSWSLAELAGEMGAPGPWRCPPRLMRTTLYVWGYGQLQEPHCREQCQASEAAIRAAIAAGWRPDRPGAWAAELTLPMGITDALRTFEPLLRSDPAVAGWELRMAPP